MTDQELIQALREHAEWAAGNEWETPLMLGDDLIAAADRIANQNTHIAALQKAIEDLRAQLDRWIPVAERLPENMCRVVVWTATEKAMIAIWDGTDWIAPFEFWKAWGDEITHWMPLPEPPEVEKP